MAKQKIYAIGSMVELAPISQPLKFFNPHTVSVPQKEINKPLFLPGITANMNFYPDLSSALEEAKKKAKDYDHDYYYDFPPVFLVEIEDKRNNQEFEVTQILNGYVIKNSKDLAVKYELNISAKEIKDILQNNTSGFASLFSFSAKPKDQITCQKNNYFGDFSQLQLRKKLVTFCNIRHFGIKEQRGGTDNHAGMLPKAIANNICEYIAGKPLQSSKDISDEQNSFSL